MRNYFQISNPFLLLKDAYYPIVITELSNTYNFKEICSFFYGEESARKKIPVIVEVGKKSSDVDKECEEPKSLAICTAVVVLKAVMLCSELVVKALMHNARKMMRPI